MADKLSSVRPRIRGVTLASAAERALLAILGAVLLSFSLDAFLEPELSVRRPFTIFIFATAALAGGAFFLRVVRRKLTDDAVAVLIEEAFPELEDGLVSSVQLARDLERGGHGHTSPALIRSVIARTAQKSAGLDFGRVVDASPLLPSTFLLLLSIGGFATFALHPSTRPVVTTWFERCVLGRDVNYPKPIDLEVTVANEHDGVTQVARGDDVSVDIVVKRGASKVDRLIVRTMGLRRDDRGRYKTKGGRPEETRLIPVGAEATRYRKLYQNVTEPFEFEVDAGSHVVSSRHRVLVVDRPRVEEARFWLTFPDYTGLPATPREKPETAPELRVPVGTEVEYRVVASKPLGRAELVFEREDPKAARPPAGQPAAVIEEAGPAPELGGTDKLAHRVLTGKFTVKYSTRFRFALRSAPDDLDDGKKPVVFTVTAVVDRPPEVKIPVPGRPKQVTPRAIVPIEIEAKDDYGLVNAELRLKIDAQGAGAAKGEQKVALAGLEEAARSALLKHRLDLAEYGLHAGDKITYRAAAFDRNLDPEKRTGESTAYQLQVISPEDLARILQDRLQRVRDELLQTAKIQKQAHDDTENLVKGLVPKTKLDEEDKRKLLLSDYEQRKVSSRLVTVAQELDRLVEERELNRLADQAELDREKEIREGAKELAEKASPIISRELDDVRRAMDLDERTKARLNSVPDAQAALQRGIEYLAERIDKWANFADVIQDVRNLMKENENVMSRTEDELRKNPGAPK